MSQRANGLIFDDSGKHLPSAAVPVLFVHSLAGNAGQWAKQWQYLAPTRRTIAPDLRGHGRSALPGDGDYAIDAMAGDLHRVVSRLDLPRIVLVGHSMGSSVAIAYAAQHPERVAGLLLVDPSGDSTQVPADEANGYLEALMSDAYPSVIEAYWQQILDGATPATHERVMQDLGTTRKETVVGVFKALFLCNPVPALQRYPGPKQAVITPLTENPIGLHRLVPDLPYDVVTGTGHWLQMDKPDEFNRIMGRFLASIDEQSAQ